MNPYSGRRRLDCGITLLEVMILMAILWVVALAVVLPSLVRPHIRSCRISCANMLKQIGLGYRQWAMDHGDHFPMHVPLTNGGTLGYPRFAEAWVQFAVLSNELSTPRLLVCPVDRKRSPATDFSGTFDNRHLSYFVGLDGDETKPNVILAGDRNLTTNGIELNPGLHPVSTNEVLGWTKAIHNRCGNICLSDGSVQQLSSVALQQHLLDNPQRNRFVLP